MKLTKLTIIGGFLILFFSNFTQSPKHFENNVIEVYFSNKLDINDLCIIKTDLIKEGIKLNYDYLKFTADGKLSAIEYHVTTKKFGGGDKTDDINKEIGFIVNFNPNAKYGIIVGSKETIKKRREVLDKQN